MCFILIYVIKGFACTYICVLHMWLVPSEAREGIRSLGSGVEGCKVLCQIWIL